MTAPTFASLPIGDCFRLGSSRRRSDAHLLRKLDSVRAEYVDGPETVPVPAGTLVHPIGRGSRRVG